MTRSGDTSSARSIVAGGFPRSHGSGMWPSPSPRPNVGPAADKRRRVLGGELKLLNDPLAARIALQTAAVQQHGAAARG